MKAFTLFFLASVALAIVDENMGAQKATESQKSDVTIALGHGQQFTIHTPDAKNTLASRKTKTLLRRRIVRLHNRHAQDAEGEATDVEVPAAGPIEEEELVPGPTEDPEGAAEGAAPGDEEVQEVIEEGSEPVETETIVEEVEAETPLKTVEAAIKALDAVADTHVEGEGYRVNKEQFEKIKKALNLFQSRLIEKENADENDQGEGEEVVEEEEGTGDDDMAGDNDVTGDPEEGEEEGPIEERRRRHRVAMKTYIVKKNHRFMKAHRVNRAQYVRVNHKRPVYRRWVVRP